MPDANRHGRYGTLHGGRNLPDQVAADWMTPVANDDNKSPEAHMAMTRRMKGGPRNTITSLSVQIKAQDWATPTVQDSENTAGPSQFGRNSEPLNVQVITAGRPDPASRSTSGKNRGSLNSRWVATLQGFPSDWLELGIETLFALSATRSSPKSRKRS